MRGNRALRCGLVALLVMSVMALAPTDALAKKKKSNQWVQLQKKIKATQDKIRAARAKERGIIAQINASDFRRQQLQDALDALTAQLRDASARLDVLELAVGQAQNELTMRTADLEETMAALQDQQKVLSTRAAESYMTGPMAFTPVLFNTTDFHSFAAASEYVTSVLNQDAGVLDDIREIRTEIQADRAEIGQRKTILQAQADVVRREEAHIASLRADQRRTRDAVVGEIGYRKRLLAKVRDERQAFEEALQSLQEESDSISLILNGAQKGQKVIQGAGKGFLVWPVSGHISSGYGWRIHPIYHKRSFHTGIDIASPEGSSVAAARAGKVVFTGYKGAYGLIVLLDHGDSLATMYAHLSKVYVRAGDKVKKKESIAAVGCTGWCTGPHVHFEVRVQGSPRNPMNWL